MQQLGFIRISNVIFAAITKIIGIIIIIIVITVICVKQPRRYENGVLCHDRVKCRRTGRKRGERRKSCKGMTASFRCSREGRLSRSGWQLSVLYTRAGTSRVGRIVVYLVEGFWRAGPGEKAPYLCRTLVLRDFAVRILPVLFKCERNARVFSKGSESGAGISTRRQRRYGGGGKGPSAVPNAYRILVRRIACGRR